MSVTAAIDRERSRVARLQSGANETFSTTIVFAMNERVQEALGKVASVRRAAAKVVQPEIVLVFVDAKGHNRATFATPDSTLADEKLAERMAHTVAVMSAKRTLAVSGGSLEHTDASGDLDAYKRAIDAISLRGAFPLYTEAGEKFGAVAVAGDTPDVCEFLAAVAGKGYHAPFAIRAPAYVTMKHADLLG